MELGTHFCVLVCLADILDRLAPKLEELGLEYECVGGGRIEHSRQNKTINVYGYSMVSSVCVRFRPR